MKLGADPAPWLPVMVAALRKNRPPAYELQTAALVSGEAGATYLVVEWMAGRPLVRPPPVELHKVVRGGDGRRRIKWLRSLDEELTELSPLSGRVLFEGEAPVVVVNLDGGGSIPSNKRVRLIQLRANSVDITPDWAGRTVNAVDLDGDGRFEVITDNRQVIITFGQANYGPFLPAVLSRSNGRFYYDCRSFESYFLDWSSAIATASIRHPSMPQYQLAWFAAAFLGFLQVGAFDDARRILDRIAGIAEAHRPDDFTAAQIEEDLVAVLDWASKHPEEGCLASAPDNPGGPNGALLGKDLRLRQESGIPAER